MPHTFLVSPVSLSALAAALALSAPASAQLVGDDAPPPSSPLMINGAPAGADQAEDGDDRGSRNARRGRGHRRLDVHPYIEVGQVVSADLSDGGDVLTYSMVAVGVQGTIETRRAQVAADVRYEHRFSWNDRLSDTDVISGLLRGAYALGGGLSLEGGALATRASIDGRNGTANFGVGDQGNHSTVYSVYAGPTFARHIGDLDVGAAYRFGYSRAEVDLGTAITGTTPFGTFDDATNHSALASVGMRPGGWGGLPFGWRLSGGYDYEKAGQLDQRYRGAFGRADVTLPLSPTLALVGGVGYEDIRVSNDAPLINTTTGAPVLDTRGRLVSDPAQPRQIAFETDGLIYDAGVLWRPSRRVSLEARVGRRYGDMSYTGSATWQESDDVGYQLAVYDTVSTIGRSLSSGLAALSTDFTALRNGIDGSLSGCAFGGAGGTCLTPTLNNLSGFAFRNRGAVLAMSSRMRRWTFGAALGYDRRTYLARGVTALAGLDGSVDETWYAALSASHPIGQDTTWGTSAYATLFDPGLAGAGETTSAGVSTAISHIFFPRLSGTAAFSLDAINPDNRESRIFASALFGLRYTY